MTELFGGEGTLKILGKRRFRFLMALFTVFISSSVCHAQEIPSAIIVSRLAVEDARGSGKEAAIAADLLAAERFCAAPVRGDMLLATYDCVIPLGDYQFYCHSAGKVVSLELWAADPWMNLAILKAKESIFEPMRISDELAPIENGQVFDLPTNDFTVDRSATVAADSLTLKTPSDDAAQSVHEFGELVGVESKQSLPPGTPLLDANGALRLIALGIPAEHSESQSLCMVVDRACAKAIASLLTGEPLAYGFLGLEPADVSDLSDSLGRRGVYARHVTEHSPAKLAGIREENRRTREVDLITQIDGLPVESSQQLLAFMGRMSFGEKVRLEVKRGKTDERGSTMQVECTLGKRFANPRRPAFSQKQKYVWRGISVDYFTAIDDFAARARLVDPDGCVVIVSVDQESSAWKAGLRAGMFLVKVNGARLNNEADFEKATKPLSGAALLVTTSRADGLRLEPQNFELAP